MANYSVYIHTAPNGKKYVGITCQKPARRWHGGSGYRAQPKFYNAIRKYGWNNFTHEIVLSGAAKELACQYEQDLIALYDSVRNGYNQTTGGEVGYKLPQSEESRRKISKALKGKPKSDEHRAKSCAQLEKNRLERQRGVTCVETGDTFISVKEAADAYDLESAHITECCQGKRKTHGKLHWKYWEVYDGEETLGESGINRSPI